VSGVSGANEFAREKVEEGGQAMSGIMNHIAQGQSMPVLLVDGIEHTPHLAGTLSLLERGVTVTIPFVQGEAQFASVEAWFRNHEVPHHLFAYSNNLRMSLFGCGWAGSHERHTAISSAEGTISVEEALMARWEGAFDEPLAIKEVRSEMDGLHEFARLTSITRDIETTGEGWTLNNKLLITVDARDGMEWTQGEATMVIATSWKEEGGRDLHVLDKATLTSTFETPRPFRQHLAEQRKFVALLSLIFGKPVSFRRHVVRDENLRTRTVDGSAHGYTSVELISSQTVRDYSTTTDEDDFKWPLTRMSLLSSETLTRWGESYEGWARFLLPTVSLLRFKSLFMENNLINAAMSFEAFGKHIVTSVDGEDVTYHHGRPATATYVLRGVKTLSIDWSAVAPDESAVARGITKFYNALKHPNNLEFPDSLETLILSEIAVGVIRLLALHTVMTAEEYAQVDLTQVFRRPFEYARQNNLRLTESGQFETIADDSSSSAATNSVPPGITLG
jgi:hypothetical protein